MVNKTSSDTDGNSVVTASELDAIIRDIDALRGEVAETRASLAEYRALAEERMDEVVSLREEIGTIRETLAGGIKGDDFATRADLERIRTDLDKVAQDRADVAVNVASGDGEFGAAVDGFEGGLIPHIINTYFAGEVARYRRAVDAEARKPS